MTDGSLSIRVCGRLEELVGGTNLSCWSEIGGCQSFKLLCSLRG